MLAVAVNRERVALAPHAKEPRDHQRILPLRRLPGPINVEIAQRHDAHAEQPGEHVGVLLPHQFLQSVGRLGVGGHVLAHQVGRLVAVHAGRGRVDHPAHTVDPRRDEHVQRARHIDLVCAPRVVDRARDAGPRRRVKHHLGALGCICQRGRVRHGTI